MACTVLGGGALVAELRIAAGSGTWLAFLVGEDTDEADSIALVHGIFADGRVRTIDTSNNYGMGESERRIGKAIREYGGVPDGVVIQTKADRDMATGEFTGERMRRSLEESLERLGLDRFPVLHLHDPENTSWDQAMSDDGPVAALVAARDEGLIGELGVAGGPVRLMRRFVDTGLFTRLITHNRFTLVDRSADELISAAHERGIHVSNASPYGGGILTAWPPTVGRYAYDVIKPGMLRSCDGFAAVCADHGVTLAAAALHWSLDDPRIDETIVGMRSLRDLESTIALAEQTVPAAFWDDAASVPLARDEWQDVPDGRWQP
ncbi:MAG TPA: aldo/keto reductase [Cellulomonas sp.]